MSVHTQDMDYWPLLISQPPDGAPHDHPQKKTLISALPVLYLRHSKDWRLARPFILAGGLGALSDLLVHENLYLRSQVHTHTHAHAHAHTHTHTHTHTHATLLEFSTTYYLRTHSLLLLATY